MRVLRAKMIPVSAPTDAIDCCGTGGDAKGTLNVSTAVTFVLAGAGVRVAKHGNRALSSKTGAADVLTALGVKIDVPAAVISQAIHQGAGFMMAPTHHAAMKHVAAVRQALGIRTIFNLMGPLSNPAGVKRQLVGVYAPEWLEPIARTLRELGSEAAWVVHGGGLDELTVTGPSKVAELKNGEIRAFEITPEDAGLPRSEFPALLGGAASENAAKLTALLAGERSAYRDIVVLNAAACFLVAGKAVNLRSGAEMAARAIDSGQAAEALAKLVAITNR